MHKSDGTLRMVHWRRWKLDDYAGDKAVPKAMASSGTLGFVTWNQAVSWSASWMWDPSSRTLGGNGFVSFDMVV